MFMYMFRYMYMYYILYVLSEQQFVEAFGTTEALSDGQLPVYDEVCIPCRRAFAGRRSWAAHCARKHGYRSHAFLCATSTVCRSCGRRYANVGRLRRHLLGNPSCLSSWGCFTPGAIDKEAPHEQAPLFKGPTMRPRGN